MYFLTKLCRICVQTKQALISIDTVDYDSVSFSEKLEICTKLVVKSQKEISKEICPSCIYKLRISYEFYNMCKKSSSILNGYVSKLLSRSFPYRSQSSSSPNEPSQNHSFQGGTENDSRETGLSIGNSLNNSSSNSLNNSLSDSLNNSFNSPLNSSLNNALNNSALDNLLNRSSPNNSASHNSLINNLSFNRSSLNSSSPTMFETDYFPNAKLYISLTKTPLNQRKRRVGKSERCAAMQKLLSSKQQEFVNNSSNDSCTVAIRSDKPRGGLKDLLSFTKSFDFGYNINNQPVDTVEDDSPLDRLIEFSESFFYEGFAAYRKSILCVIESKRVYEVSGDYCHVKNYSNSKYPSNSKDCSTFGNGSNSGDYSNSNDCLNSEDYFNSSLYHFENFSQSDDSDIEDMFESCDEDEPKSLTFEEIVLPPCEIKQELLDESVSCSNDPEIIDKALCSDETDECTDPTNYLQICYSSENIKVEDHLHDYQYSINNNDENCISKSLDANSFDLKSIDRKSFGLKSLDSKPYVSKSLDPKPFNSKRVYSKTSDSNNFDSKSIEPKLSVLREATPDCRTDCPSTSSSRSARNYIFNSKLQERVDHQNQADLNMLSKLTESVNESANYPFKRCKMISEPYISPKLQRQFLTCNFKCDTCNRNFKSHGYLKAHNSKVHSSYK